MNERWPTQTITATGGSVQPISTGATARSRFSRTAEYRLVRTVSIALYRECCADPLEHQIAVLSVDPDGVALAEITLEEPQRERVLEEALDRALERPGAVGGVPTGVGDHALRLVGQLELQATLGEPAPEPPELLLDDLADLVA